MISAAATRALVEMLAAERQPVYAVIDGAGCPALLPMLDRHQVRRECLYRGELEPELAEAAPYLARLDLDGPFARWFLGEGWDRHWGILLQSDAALPEIRGHLRRLTLARLPDQRVVYFRFYDPRVARAYLPSCTEAEARRVFGPCTTMLLEDAAPATVLRLTPAAGGVAAARIPLPG